MVEGDPPALPDSRVRRLEKIRDYFISQEMLQLLLEHYNPLDILNYVGQQLVVVTRINKIYY